jgi:hypothetical protein
MGQAVMVVKFMVGANGEIDQDSINSPSGRPQVRRIPHAFVGVWRDIVTVTLFCFIARRAISVRPAERALPSM